MTLDYILISAWQSGQDSNVRAPAILPLPSVVLPSSQALTVNLSGHQNGPGVRGVIDLCWTGRQKY